MNICHVIAAGVPTPDFRLARCSGGTFTRRDLRNATTVLLFVPFLVSPVGIEALSVYNAALGGFRERGATVLGVSCDAPRMLQALRSHHSIDFELLLDSEHGAACWAFGVVPEESHPHRALVVIGPDAVVRWSWDTFSLTHPAPGTEVLAALDALDAGVVPAAGPTEGTS